MSIDLLTGDAVEVLRTLRSRSVDCVVTSPPYFGLRDYGGNEGQIGLEESPTAYVARLVSVFAEVRRVLADDGTLWLNVGDSYSGSWGNQGRKEQRGSQRPVNAPMIQKVHDGRYPTTGTRTGTIRPGAPRGKNLFGIPWRTAFALQDDGWFLRNAIVWHKPNAMPTSVRDRLANKHEMLFFLTKSPRYWFDLDQVRTDTGGNPGDVWTITRRSRAGGHTAAFPEDVPLRCIKAGCRPGGTVLDPFSGSGTTVVAAQQLGHPAIGIDLNPAYHAIARRRLGLAGAE